MQMSKSAQCKTTEGQRHCPVLLKNLTANLMKLAFWVVCRGCSSFCRREGAIGQRSKLDKENRIGGAFVGGSPATKDRTLE